MKRLLLLLLLFSLSFAEDGEIGWQALSMFAAFTAFALLIVLYVLTYLFEVPELRGLAIEEMYQVGVTLIFLAIFVGLDAYATTTLSEAFGAAFSSDGDLMSTTEGVTADIAGYEWDLLKDTTTKLAIPWGSLSSISATCSILGSSISYSSCIGIQIPFSSIIFASNAMATALMTTNSQIYLLNVAQNFLFPVLLPIGLFLRCFQFTRGAGGLMIAIAVSFYFIFPVSILLTTGMLNKAAGVMEANDRPVGPEFPSIDAPSDDFATELETLEVRGDCNPLDMDQKAARKQAKHIVGDEGDTLVDPLLFQLFIGGLFSSMLSLLITLSAVRALASLFGSEVDISGLARIS